MPLTIVRETEENNLKRLKKLTSSIYLVNELIILYVPIL